jgi:hypothetical protein
MLWAAAGVVALGLAAAGPARADTVYFKNGTSMWGEDAVEEGDQVSIVRGGQIVKFPKADVLRIEKRRTNMPDYKVDLPPPTPAAGPARGGPAVPPAGAAAAPPPPGVEVSGPGGPPGAMPPPGSGAPQGAIPIPGAGGGGPPQPPYAPPGVAPPTGTPR